MTQNGEFDFSEGDPERARRSTPPTRESAPENASVPALPVADASPHRIPPAAADDDAALGKAAASPARIHRAAVVAAPAPAGASSRRILPATSDAASAPAGASAAAAPPDHINSAATMSAAGDSAAQSAAGALAASNARKAVFAAAGVAVHVAGLDWQAIAAELAAQGYAIVPGMLTADECVAMAAQYAQPALFRSRVVMSQHGYGSGEYQYFRYPLPSTVSALRQSLYGPLAAIANHWHDVLHIEARFPSDHADFLARCHAAGQQRPTPLLLQYGPGDYNCLHQDLYGEHVFPLQAAILLSQPGADFDGGEFVLTEQRPRMQSRVEVVPLKQGDMVIFPVNHRPAQGARGVYRVQMRHGVSRLRRGARHTLGIIFHDAQ